MNDTKHTPGIPDRLEFDPDNYGTCRPSYGLLAEGRGSRINIEGSEDITHALEREVVKRWNCHDDLVAALKRTIHAMSKQGLDDGYPEIWEQAWAALAKAGEK